MLQTSSCVHQLGNGVLLHEGWIWPSKTNTAFRVWHWLLFSPVNWQDTHLSSSIQMTCCERIYRNMPIWWAHMHICHYLWINRKGKSFFRVLQKLSTSSWPSRNRDCTCEDYAIDHPPQTLSIMSTPFRRESLASKCKPSVNCFQQPVPQKKTQSAQHGPLEGQ